jgi:hypothetical protein
MAGRVIYEEYVGEYLVLADDSAWPIEVIGPDTTEDESGEHLVLDTELTWGIIIALIRALRAVRGG